MINIGTNFSYKGILFLDDRQGIARSKSDLRNWSIPVPEGFEVYLPLEGDSAWYTYKSDYNSTETGHFERRLDKAYVDNQIAIINNEINNIWYGPEGIYALWDAIGDYTVPTQIVWSATFGPTNSGGYIWLPGNTITPSLTWSLSEKNLLTNQTSPIPFSEIDSATINNSPIAINGHWTASSPISSNTTYNLVVEYKGTRYTKSQTYSFRKYDWMKYAGVSASPVLSSVNNLYPPQITDLNPSTPRGKGWGSVGVGFEYTYDCTGGRYPFYVFPTSLWNASTFKMYVGGVTWDTNIEEGNLTIDGVSYKTIRTGNIQYNPNLYLKFV